MTVKLSVVLVHDEGSSLWTLSYTFMTTTRLYGVFYINIKATTFEFFDYSFLQLMKFGTLSLSKIGLTLRNVATFTRNDCCCIVQPSIFTNSYLSQSSTQQIITPKLARDLSLALLLQHTLLTF